MSLPTNQMIDSDVRLSRDLFITTPNQAEYSVRYVANMNSCYRQHITIHIVLSKISIFTRICTRSIVEENFFYVRSSGRYALVEYFSTNKTYSIVSAMSLEESRRSQRPYRYGMVLLCVGALINWLGLAENYVEPVRYVGVACIVAGALLICAAMCCWLHAPPTRTSTHTQHTNHPITAQVIHGLSPWRIYLFRQTKSSFTTNRTWKKATKGRN